MQSAELQAACGITHSSSGPSIGQVLSVDTSDVDQTSNIDQEVVQLSKHQHHVGDEVERRDQIEQLKGQDEEDSEPVEQHQPPQCAEVPPHVTQQDGYIAKVV